MKNEVNVGILGLGTVGTGVARILLEQRELLKTRTEVTLNLKAISELNWDVERNLDLSKVLCTKEAAQVYANPDVDIVVETIGGYEPAFTFISEALKHGKHVVTANKALIATRGKELLKLAEENNVNLLFEASVGGGIPIIKGLREGLIANKINSIYGILNGTSNYILSRMHQDELDFNQALQEAQAKGFAEADPTLDIGGGDAAHKLTILASFSSSSFVDYNNLSVEGITDITKLDIQFAKSFGYTIKLLAIYRDLPQGLDLRVHPTLVPNTHLLAAVNNELNAVFVNGDFVGDTMFYGPGAGERPTGSAIISDIADIARNIAAGEQNSFFNRMLKQDTCVPTLNIGEIENRFYLRFFTLDEPGILSKISGALGDCGISISSMVQLETHQHENYVPIVLLTHSAKESAVQEALEKIDKMGIVRDGYLKLRLF